MLDWLELTGGVLASYALFCAMLYGKVRRTPRPVATWLITLPTWIFLTVSGFVLPMPLFIPLINIGKEHVTDPKTFAQIGFGLYCGWGVAWGFASAFLVRFLFREGGPLCDNAIRQRHGILQRIARSAIGRGDDASTLAGSDDTVSELQELNLTERD
jgi:hypothetical protein